MKRTRRTLSFLLLGILIFGPNREVLVAGLAPVDSLPLLSPAAHGRALLGAWFCWEMLRDLLIPLQAAAWHLYC